MEGFSSNLNDTFTSTSWCAEPMFFPQHILPLLPLYNAQWWGYESLTAIVLVSCAVVCAGEPGVSCTLFLMQLSVRKDLVLPVWCFLCRCPFARTWCYLYDVSCAVVRLQGPGVTCMMFLVQLFIREDPGVTCMMFLMRLSVRKDLVLCICCFCAVVPAQGLCVMCMIFLVQLFVREDLVLRVWCFSCSCPCARTWCCVWTRCRRSCPGRWTTCSSNMMSTKTAPRSETRKVTLELFFNQVFNENRVIVMLKSTAGGRASTFGFHSKT